MKVKEFFNKYLEKIKFYIEGLTSKQKLIYSIVFVIVMAFIVKVIFGNIIKNKESIISYDKISGEEMYITSQSFDDDNTYVILKSISDDIINEIMDKKRYSNGKLVSTKEIYNSVLTTDYRRNISLSKFKKLNAEIANKISEIKNNDLDIVPYSIVEYTEDYYLVQFSSKVGEQEINFYIGIVLNSVTKQYYIWYLE